MKIPESLNLNYLDEQYQRYKSNPQSVSRQWRLFFYGFEIAEQQTGPAPQVIDGLESMQVAQLIQRYRDLGHLLACLDPLSACPTSHPLLALDNFGFSSDDLSKRFATPQFPFAPQCTLKQILEILNQTYCRSTGVEYMHLQDPDERGWLQERMEPVRNRLRPDAPTQKRILDKLVRAASLERFLNKKYQAVTRFSLEGGDALIPMLDALLVRLSQLGTQEVVLGMAHRGRLNVQANLLQRPVEEIFAEFETCYDADQLIGDGDVKYHNGYLATIDLPEEGVLRAFLLNNPSHLEAVDPVVQGVVRARQQRCADVERQQVVPLLLHGDAAFAGQGVVAETLNMSQLKGYTTGGTIHVVINNQIGYTTLPDDARSTRYSTDVAKMLMVPIFHVHGEDPEVLVHVAQLAAAYRSKFKKDVVIDLVCYRRYGHNEGDEPYFTQPLMYDRIKSRPPVHELYAQQLVEAGVIDDRAADQWMEARMEGLEAAYRKVHGSSCLFPQSRCFEEMERYSSPYSLAPVDTTVPEERLMALAAKLNQLPPGFTPHNKIKTLLQRRMQSIEKRQGIDWANAETLAFGSLLAEGLPVRLSGQDCGRGTFSQRHSVLFDRENGKSYAPLNHLEPEQARYDVYNSLLAEAGVLGFEYGYAISHPEGLTLWEAQFGDFANNAQGIIDLFIVSGETKWQCRNGLTLLLPHGWEGLGPEHSSARLERFLQLCAHDNIQVCNVTTPAQYFHLLRRQAKAPYRKPLVVMTPKSLLRHPKAVSTLTELAQGEFHPVLEDRAASPGATKVLICSGKIYYQLRQRCREIDAGHIALVRLEQLYPFPQQQLQAVLQTYADAVAWGWVQEEPENMGGWKFVQHRLQAIIGQAPFFVGRPAAASPASGFPSIYQRQQAAISDEAVGPLTD
jgi:2-oxoglutarate dehydrogenase E1 component